MSTEFQTINEWAAWAVSGALGVDVSGVRRVHGHEGGYSDAVRRVAELADGRSVFVKIGTSPSLSQQIRHECEVYDDLGGTFMLRKLGAVDTGTRAALILENVEDSDWPPPWDERQIRPVADMLEEVRTTVPPRWLVWVGGPHELRQKSTAWQRVAADARPLLATGIVTETWLDQNLTTLLDSEMCADLDGPALVHLDVRSDNICFIAGRPKLIDWTAARLGHPYLDQHYWATTLHNETGQRHTDLLQEGATHQLTLLAGYYAGAMKSSDDLNSPTVLSSNRYAALQALLPWVCDLLDLEPPVL